MYFSLNGDWLFKQKDGEEWLNAHVPSTNYTDLLALGKIPDPFVGLNEEKTFWVGEKDWIYHKDFWVDETIFAFPKCFLECEMLDTVCEVRLNGMEVGKGDNCHIRYRFDIKNALQCGKNELEICFFSPVQYIKMMGETLPIFHNNNGLDGDTLIRKPHCHFGWDWGPTLPTCGIPKNIGIYYGEEPYIEDMKVIQTHRGAVDLRVEANVSGVQNGCIYTITVFTPDGQKIWKEGTIANGIVSDIITIDKPHLWWTNDIKDVPCQPLYTVSLSVSEENFTVEKSLRIGLRTLKLEREKDEYGVSFRFILNGVRIFCKGANWIPADSFEDRVTEKRLRYLIGSARFSHMNMLRVWGGGLYGSDEFYNICDEEGILVWQDCAFACQAYPFENEWFRGKCLEEIENVVKRIRNHPSLALWCGNNEVEHSNMWRMKIPSMRPMMTHWEKFFWHDLGQKISEFDSETPYIPGSPTGSAFMREFADDTTGDTHLWQVWHGMQNPKYYRNRYTRFCSEFGFECLPDKKTVRYFTEGKNLNISSKVFSAHQKCRSGNQKMVYYIGNRFRSPKHFDDFIYLSQICQMECVRDATEFWRRNRHRCNGALYWQINDCWPVVSWASIDYFGNYKALQYVARHTNSPISISVADDTDKIGIFLVNDTLKAVKGSVHYGFYDFCEGLQESKKFDCEIEPLLAKEVFSLPMGEVKFNLKKTVFVAELSDEKGNILNRKTVLFDREKNLLLPKTEVSMKAYREGEEIKIYISSVRFARLVCITNDRVSSPLSDNWFDLLPGEERTVTMPYYDGFKEKDFSVTCANNIEPAQSRFRDNLNRLSFLLKPRNLAVFIVNRPSRLKRKKKE